MLFIDFSSAFNTINPQHLFEKLSLLGINTSLCNWIPDFLTGRSWSVQIGNSTSSATTLNTGAPQGYVLSPLLFTLLTHDCAAMHSFNHIIKFANYTTMVGLISKNDESAYREEVQWLTAWCTANNLSLNVEKMKEMVNFRRAQNDHSPLNINGSNMEMVKSTKFLGIYLAEIGVSLPSIIDIYSTRCICKANSIVDDPTHPTHPPAVWKEVNLNTTSFGEQFSYLKKKVSETKRQNGDTQTPCNYGDMIKRDADEGDWDEGRRSQFLGISALALWAPLAERLAEGSAPCLATGIHTLTQGIVGPDVDRSSYAWASLSGHSASSLCDVPNQKDKSHWPGLTTTAIGAVDLQGAGGNWATVGGRSRGGRRVHRQREKRKGKSVGLRIGTLNVGTMTGKGRELADMMERRKVDILCVQETRWKGSKARSIGAGFKLFYYGVDSKRNGVGVVLKEEFVRNVLEVKRVSDRVMRLKLEIEGVMLNVVSGYAPQVGCELEEKERFWSELDEVMESIPMGERVVIGADFNGHVGEGNRGDEEVMGKFGVKEKNLEGQMVVDFAKRMDMGVVNTYFQKREEHRVTYKSGGRRTQVDYILCRRGNLKEISDCKVVVGESVARQHRMVVCRMTLMVCKKKRSEIEKKTKWWKLKKEECCEEFRQKLRQALGGQVVLPDDWETTAEVIRETGRKVLGVSSGRRKEDKETWWWNEEVQDSIQRKRLAKKKWDMDRTEENRQEYKELQRRVKREVSKATQKAYDELYTRLDTREGEKDLYRLARQRDRDGKDVQQVRVIKDREGRVLTSEESVQRRWKEYFEELMNEENEREKKSRNGELCGTESR
ncbi:hypothetical protein QTP70_007721 [Hemibagrus guttatus]|uniref:Reverse transcriptase domain-containing protein n=1 Tax=Hemibagrus guttatus TaxID=175788 RepID=A0AAE0UY10_9TELE|nr:hypothetical protein QTP70_007721 [Hemibagrus guttatus]